MQLLLACDTSTAYLTLGLCARDTPESAPRFLGETTVHAGRRHAETLFPSTKWLLAETGYFLADLTHLAVTVGPGSFTGLRIGVASWKGMAYGLNLPLIGVPTLDALSRLHPWREETVCTLLDARMSEVFCAAYQYTGFARTKLRQDGVLPPEAAIKDLPADTVFCGDGALAYAALIREHYPNGTLLPESHAAPSARAVALEAFDRLDAGVCTNGALVEPVYLRKTQAEYNRDLAEAAKA